MEIEGSLIPATSSHLGPNILLSTMFSNIINQCSFLNVTDFYTNTKQL